MEYKILSFGETLLEIHETHAGHLDGLTCIAPTKNGPRCSSNLMKRSKIRSSIRNLLCTIQRPTHDFREQLLSIVLCGRHTRTQTPAMKILGVWGLNDREEPDDDNDCSGDNGDAPTDDDTQSDPFKIGTTLQQSPHSRTPSFKTPPSSPVRSLSFAQSPPTSLSTPRRQSTPRRESTPRRQSTPRRRSILRGQSPPTSPSTQNPSSSTQLPSEHDGASSKRRYYRPPLNRQNSPVSAITGRRISHPIPSSPPRSANGSNSPKASTTPARRPPVRGRRPHSQGADEVYGGYRTMPSGMQLNGSVSMPETPLSPSPRSGAHSSTGKWMRSHGGSEEVYETSEIPGAIQLDGTASTTEIPLTPSPDSRVHHDMWRGFLLPIFRLINNLPARAGISSPNVVHPLNTPAGEGVASNQPSPRPKPPIEPGRIDDEIRKRLLTGPRSHPNIIHDDGTVYIWKHKMENPPLVKIGCTTGTTSSRRPCERDAYELKAGTKLWIKGLYMLAEQLCFKELADRQETPVRCGICSISHKEYYRVSAEHAERVRLRWLRWLREEPYDEDGYLKPFWDERLLKLELNLTRPDSLEARYERWTWFTNPWLWDEFCWRNELQISLLLQNWIPLLGVISLAVVIAVLNSSLGFWPTCVVVGLLVLFMSWIWWTSIARVHKVPKNRARKRKKS
ncbi:hypothetical protein P152DRAFT_457649 [Eremomyces bilateralis CBS 781.70]|uniref:Bacteriophage T5 Orf172 DNA-binding domain-containing protein n=1 Tax=Eremomyces bilateralis CBS 781.70 TaxID=1392243 RepID=A0A6G1G5Q9_9PEZI|nr:uncharacterized protein P152DRAFT_457649 [Eremomyces bilateralis CBS 781.70]KAF1813281.1 hypothetical protein P152DRAFT_457649 [Eremomyces bilateralis CBS 781.70]